MTDNRDIINLKLGNVVETIPEEIINMCIAEITVKIKEYCNITKIPEGLRYTHANMVVDLIKYTISQIGTTNPPTPEEPETSEEGNEGEGGNVAETTNSSFSNITGTISNVSLGDMKISFDTSSSGSSHSSNLDDIVMNYRETLNKYRKVVWN